MTTSMRASLLAFAAACVGCQHPTAFAREVYAFCPDVVDQGTETVEALAAEMKQENTVYLWWD